MEYKNYVIRNERKEDCRIVEEMIREAFWNVHEPGCNEHYLAHLLRGHENFIPELNFVLEEEAKIVGNIMFAESKLVSIDGEEMKVLTFGPLSVHPDYQRKGYGKALVEYSFDKALKMGYKVCVIFGHPSNYISRGFKNCKKYNVFVGEKVYPTAMLVCELEEGTLEGKVWEYQESPAYEIDESGFDAFDKEFPYKEKEYRRSQEEFYIYSHSQIVW